ncbi:junctional adhesion molecule 2A-like [Macrobrachium rosenbergii]|uniref:junctional adhesion molecule 2A-like n=1 Tax=Macrobrachium rosenbergii TaxID=79674 RepID=UPI0034D6A347
MCATERWFSFVAIVVTTFLQGCHTIRITKIEVPPILKVGGSGELDCVWEEDNDHMYSIKWYQAAQEFYRYTPTSSEPIQIFDPPTLDVDGGRSWGGSVRITNVSQTATGPFHCEVSADGPTFHTASEQANLTVVDTPDEEPEIQGVESHYSSGDWIDINCTSRRSHPPAQLSFTVNNQPAPLGWTEPQRDTTDENGLTTSVLRLHFYLAPRLLQDGQARIRCQSEIPGVYEKWTEEVIMTSRPYHASVLDGATAGCSVTTFGSLWLLALLLFHSSNTPYL